MSKLNRRTTALLAVLSLTALSACSAGSPDATESSGNAADGAEITIGYAMPDASVTYWTAYLAGVEDKAAELGVEVTFTDARNDTNTQLEQVNSLIVTGVDGIVLPPVDTTSLTGAAQATDDAGIPMITSNRALDMDYGGADGTNPRVHVGFNDVEVGRQQGELVTSLCGTDPCSVALLMQPLGSTPQIERTQGLKEVLDQTSTIEIVTEQSDNLDANTAQELTRTILQQYPDLNVIASQYDDTAIAAAQVVNELGRSDVRVVGIGGSKSGIAGVESGELTGTVWVSPRTDGAVALEAIVAILRGEELTDVQEVNGRPTVPVGLVQVTKENVAEYPGEW